MATPEINENCHCVQNDPHRCKIKLEKFHFEILCCFGVIRESLPGGANPPLQVRGLKGGGDRLNFEISLFLGIFKISLVQYKQVYIF